jgi:hypothetical protein|tara:strand:- start:14143 stop:14409 length:267 start_codon:yes stop_codon:yes gene_type:complete
LGTQLGTFTDGKCLKVTTLGSSGLKFESGELGSDIVASAVRAVGAHLAAFETIVGKETNVRSCSGQLGGQVSRFWTNLGSRIGDSKEK